MGFSIFVSFKVEKRKIFKFIGALADILTNFTIIKDILLLKLRKLPYPFREPVVYRDKQKCKVA